MKKFVWLIFSLFIGFSCFAERVIGEVEGIKYFVNDEKKYNEAIYTGHDIKIMEQIAEEIKVQLCGSVFKPCDGYGVYISNAEEALYTENGLTSSFDIKDLVMFSTATKLSEYSYILFLDDTSVCYFLQINKNVWLYVFAKP